MPSSPRDASAITVQLWLGSKSSMKKARAMGKAQFKQPREDSTREIEPEKARPRAVIGRKSLDQIQVFANDPTIR